MLMPEKIRKMYELLGREKIQQMVPPDPTDIKGRVFTQVVRNCMVPAFHNASIGTSDTGKFSAVLIWGHGAMVKALHIAERDGIPIILCEDGMIRSPDTWCNKLLPKSENKSVSIVTDANGYYFDATRGNRLIEMLNGNQEISEQDHIRVKKFINLITREKISKYNHQPLTTPIDVNRIGTNNVLVIDQSYGDFSISRGGADDSTFQSMLNDAIRENPDRKILVKTHPDAIAAGTQRKGYYQGMSAYDNVIPVFSPCNPYSLMELVDKVYVCTSQFGLEALMAGKEVYVYGRPFYAGWGLTHDKQDFLGMRTRNRSLFDVVYYMYYKYTKWNNPDTNKPCSVEESCKWILRHRK